MTPLSKLTPAERAALAERVRAERAAQGLPERIEDPAALDAIATVVRAAAVSGEHRRAGS